MANLLGWGSLALGAAGLYNSYTQGEDAADAGAASTSIAEEQLAMAQEASARYTDIYGSLEENLSDYYTTLTPSKAIDLGLSRYETQFKEAEKTNTSNMAQRGLAGSGIEAEASMKMNTQAASDKANIISDAETQTRNDQLGFLGVGLGQSNIATQNVNNAYGNVANAYGNEQSAFAQSSAASSQGVSSLISGASYAYGRDSSIFG